MIVRKEIGSSLALLYLYSVVTAVGTKSNDVSSRESGSRRVNQSKDHNTYEILAQVL